MTSPATGFLTRPNHHRYPSAIPAWWMVSLLCFAGIFSIIDRFVLNIMVDDIRQDLAITDVQISLLQGLAFGFFYAFMGIPLGLTADRVARKWLVVAGISVWSTATLFSGYAGNFTELFVARLMVGLGEAALGPAAISLIGDLFAPHKRGRPTSVYMMGQGLATGLAITLTGLIMAWAGAGYFEVFGLFNNLSPWRMTFVLCGLGGLVLAIILSSTTREPLRQQAPKESGNPDKGLMFFWKNRAFFVPLYLGFAICFLAAYGAGAWQPTMLIRVYDADTNFLAGWLGPMTMGFSLLGPFLAGNILDWRAQRGDSNAAFYILMIAPFFAMFSAFAPMLGKLLPATFLVASNCAAFAMIGTTVFVILQSKVPPNMRGIAIAFTGVSNTILGASLGPLLIALLTEHIFRNENKVGLSILLVMIPALLTATFLFFLAWKAHKHKANGASNF